MAAPPDPGPWSASRRRRRRHAPRLHHLPTATGRLGLDLLAAALALLFLLLLLLPTTTTAAVGAAAVPDKYANVRGIVLRLLGQERGTAFLAQVSFETLAPEEDGLDVFELESPAAPAMASDIVVVTIRGSSPVALAQGLGWYLKYHCHAFVGSWDNRRVRGRATGRQLGSIDVDDLPRVERKARVRSAVRWRYYMNVCTVSYSMAWWDWHRWEEELDWMALSGINLALAFTGQEHLWMKLFEAYGVTAEDLTEGYFTGPAFLAWQRMGNIQKWGGPLSVQGFIRPQHELQLQILGRMKLLGITPVLPAFSGFLPPALLPLLPANASVSRLPDWNGFSRDGLDMSAVLLLEPTDPLFAELGQRFIELQREAYGPEVTHIYSADTYNEMDPKTHDPAYLKRASAGVIAGMRAADPEAVWLMQGWLFHSPFWTPDAMAAYLSGVPDDAMIVLDLNSNVSPVWRALAANGKPFVWNMLHNYGGRRALYGNLPAIATQPRRDFVEAQGLMLGTGITMEAIEHNPVVYDFMLEMAWRLEDADPPDVYDWVGQYARRRYGSQDPRLRRAWALLADAVYCIEEEGARSLLSPIVREPSFDMDSERLTNVTGLVEAWGLLLAAAENIDGSTTSTVSPSPLGYDLVDVTRQALADAFAEALPRFRAAFDEAMRAKTITSTSTGAGGRPGGLRMAARVGGDDQEEASPFVDVCSQERQPSPLDRLRCLDGRMLGMVDDTEVILASNANFLLGTWIADARAWAASPEEADLLEFNARNQVTLWGPTGNINDYASKQWAGLIADYHRARWALFVAQALATVEDPVATAFDQDAFHQQAVAFGQRFGATTAREVRYPTEPTGDTVAIARRLFDKYVRTRRQQEQEK